MKIGQYRQRQHCKHVECNFWQTFASRGFVSDSWAFLLNFAQRKSMSKVKLNFGLSPDFSIQLKVSLSESLSERLSQMLTIISTVAA